MSSNTNANVNAKVNPFYIHDDEEDPWDDDDDDYDDEQVMLIGGSGANNNRKYNMPNTFLNSASSTLRHRPSPFGLENSSRSYQDGTFDMHGRHSQHRPQLLKYLIVFMAIAIIVIFQTDEKASTAAGDLIENKFDNNGFRIVVLGERHSGTGWMRDRLRECFPHVQVSTDLQRSGYFFQDNEETVRSRDELLVGGGGGGRGSHSDKQTPPNDYQDTVVVHMTLNPYDWLEQMRLSPEYAPDHTGTHQELGHVVPLGWQEFLSKPWTTDRPETDLLLANETGPVCQMGFHYHEVVSCSGSASGVGDPMYELQREKEGLPFESIIDLRTAKLKNHHGVQESWTSVKKFIQIQYETVPQDFKNLLEDILEFSDRNKNETDSDDGISNLPCRWKVLPPSLDSSNGMTREYVDYVKEQVDWEAEQAYASYVAWTENEIVAKGIRREPVPTPPLQEEEESPSSSSAAAAAVTTDANEEIIDKEDVAVEKALDEVINNAEEETDTTETSAETSRSPTDQSSETISETNAEDQPQEPEANSDGPENDVTTEISGESSPPPLDQSSEPVVTKNAEEQPNENVANIDDPEIKDSTETADTDVIETANESPTNEDLIEEETTEATQDNNELSPEEGQNVDETPKETEVSPNESVAVDEKEGESSSAIAASDEKEAPVPDTNVADSSETVTETTVSTSVENTVEEESGTVEADASENDVSDKSNEETQLAAKKEVEVGNDDSKPPPEPTPDTTKVETINDEKEKETDSEGENASNNPEQPPAPDTKEELSATEKEKEAEGDANSASVENASAAEVEVEASKDQAVEESKSESDATR